MTLGSPFLLDVILILVFLNQIGQAQENYDPARANPNFGITCQGPPPDCLLPHILEWNPNESTLQQICAKPQYGGKFAQGVGSLGLSGFCFPNVPGDQGRGPGIVAFDSNTVYIRAPEENRPVTLYNQRLLLYCRDRCFCSRRRDGGTVTAKPKGFHAHNAPLLAPLRNSYVIKLDVLDDFDIPSINHQGVGFAIVPTTFITWTNQLLVQRRRFSYRSTEVTVDPGNRIQCLDNDDVPVFPIPEPYISTDFNSPKNICANAFSGGNPGANAGGYCHRTIVQDGVRKDLFFSDDITPRLEWTWGANFEFSSLVRFWCFQRCWCEAMPRPLHSATTGLWEFLANADIIEKGSHVFIRAKTLDGSSTTFSLDPGATNAGGTVAQKSWPTDILGPKPLAPPVGRLGFPIFFRPPSISSDRSGLSYSSRLEMSSMPSILSQYKCGGECSKQVASGCSAEADSGCMCAIPSPELLKQLDRQESDGVGMCIYAALLVGHLLKRRRKGFPNLFDSSMAAGIGGRSMDVESELTWTCPCNSTYASKGCCESGDGMVWEDLGLRI